PHPALGATFPGREKASPASWPHIWGLLAIKSFVRHAQVGLQSHPVIPQMKTISRREFVTIAATGAVTSLTAPGSRVTAQDVVDRIRQKIGLQWRPDSIDTFKAGDPTTVVKGIATTSMATMDVLKQAVKRGANLVITCEPTFYSRSDNVSPAPVFRSKNEFIRANGLVIWRFSEHWRERKPDPFAIGLTDILGWTKHKTAGDPSRVRIPPATLYSL